MSATELEAPATAALLAGERLRSVALESRLALAAARLALRDARLAATDVDPDELGVVVATRHAGLQDYVELYRGGTEGERPRVSPARGPQTGLNAPAAELSIRLPAAGPNATLCNGAVGGLDALAWAADQLAAGRASAMLVCEIDVEPAVLGGEPGGMATVVVLEGAGAARARGAAPRARLGAIATSFDPAGDTAETPERAAHDAHGAAAANGADARDRDGSDATSDGVLIRIANAAARLAHGEADGPLLVRASDGGAAGTAELHNHEGQDG